MRAYANISEFTEDVFGFATPLPINSFGFFVAISFILAAYFFSKELKRKEANGLLSASKRKFWKGRPPGNSDYGLAALIGFLIGYKLVYVAQNYSAFLDSPPDFILSLKGSFIGGLLGAGLSAYMRYYEWQKEKKEFPAPKQFEEEVHPHQHIGNITIVAAIGGILGAKLFHNLENWDQFVQDPIGELFSFSGLTFYGGLILGAVSVLFYAYKSKLNLVHVIDASAPALMLSYGTGRIGCQVSGDGDWGILNTSAQPSWLSWLPDWAWSYTYPHNVNNSGSYEIPGCDGNYCSALGQGVYPTPIYEIVMALFIFGILWSIRKRISIPGVLFSIYLILNGLERFLIEKIRVNTLLFGTNITQAELISSLLMLAGIIGVVYFSKNRYKYLPKAEA